MTAMEKTLTILEQRRTRGLAIALLALLSLPALSNSEGGASAIDENQFLYPEQRHENIGELVAQFIQKSHYNQIAVTMPCHQKYSTSTLTT